MRGQTINRVIKRTILTSFCGLVVYLGCSQIPVQPAKGAIPEAANTELVGIWEMTVEGISIYHYKYAISVGTWVANGDVDQGFLNYRFSPTTGAYVKNGDGSYAYRERGWTYNRGGVCIGSFETTGAFVLDVSGNTFSGPGVFKMFDLAGNTIYTEPLTAVATRVGV